MTRAALHLNDAAVTLLNAERILYRQPGFALLTDAALTTGAEAFGRARINPRHVHHRYWSALGTDRLADQYFAHLSAADLASRQLEQMWETAGSGIDELMVAVPASLDAAQLGLFLGIAGDLGLPVVAMADAAVAATRREYRNAVPVHIDCGLHSTSLTRLGQDNGAKVERSEVLEGCGTYALYDAWLTTIAEAFVRQSRFDPLHTADTEQLLLDQLGRWLGQAGRSDTVAMSLESAGISHTAEIESLRLIGAAAPWYQQIANQLRSLYRAGENPAIQVSARVASLPGLTELLKARVGGEVYALEAGASARGALARCRGGGSAGGGVNLLRQLPWDQAAIDSQPQAADSSPAGVPTHLLFRDIAWRIDERSLRLGTEGDENVRHIELPDDMPGVSRHHCELSRQNGQCIVEDHSRYGTFLNGHRINGSTVLQVGDSLRVGSPGYEFLLITTDEEHGA